MCVIDDVQGRVEAAKLLWGCDDDINSVLHMRRQQQQQQQQQQHSASSCTRPPFDLIVGSDLLYNPDGYPGCSVFRFTLFIGRPNPTPLPPPPPPALLHTLRKLCPPPPSPPTLVLLAYPPRLSAESNFIAAARAHFHVAIGQLGMGEGGDGGGVVVAECWPKQGGEGGGLM